MDAAVQTNVASAINATLVPGTAAAPGNNASAQWTSGGGAKLVTRPTGNSYTILMATIQNTSGANLPNPVISYDFGLPSALAGEDAELAGHRVYYSLTGVADSWVFVPELTSATPTPVAGAVVATLSLGAWPAGATLYMIWIDDNGGPGTDGSFSIDNFLVTSSINPPVISTQPVGTNVTEGDTISLSVVASGVGLTYQWQKAGGSIDPANPTINTPNLVITNAATTDSGTYFVTVINSAGSRTSGNAVVNVAQDFTSPTLVSAVGDPFDFTLITVTASEVLCQDTAVCGTDARFNFIWHVREKLSPDQQLGVTAAAIDASGKVVTLTTFTGRTPGVAYEVFAESLGISDVRGNANQNDVVVDLAEAVGFKQGFNGYAGTHDTELRGAAPDTVQVANQFITVDQEDAGAISDGLLRFEGVFGSGPGEVPLGSEIISATLTLTHTAANANGNPVEMHRLLIPFDEANATYNNFGTTPGLQVDGTEAATNIDTLIITAGLAVPFTITIDVKTTVQSWANGEPNFGWGFKNQGTDGYRVDSSESANPPALSIVYRTVPCTTAPSITTPPANTTVLEGASFTLGATVSACNPSFQWTKNGVDIQGANGSTYSAVAVGGPNGSAGQYRLRVTNPNGTVTSAPATLTVTEDTTGPTLTGAAAALDGTTITLNFSEALDQTSAQTLSHYALTPSVAISSAVLATNGMTVTLTTAPRAVAAYSLRISDVTDRAFRKNPINPNPTTVPLTGAALVLGYASGTWKYETNSQDATLGTISPWYAPGFSDTSWQSGQGMFGFETSAAVTNAFVAPILTVLPPNSDTNFPDAAVTAYFRRQVTLPALPAGGVYALCNFLDDGMIVYLDGTELARVNMPAPGPQVTFVTRASAAVEAAQSCLLFTASAGNHLLAIEVHQGGTTTSDVVFGAEIVALPAPPRLNISYDATNYRLSWTGDSAWQLVSAGLVNGGYNAVAGNPLGALSVPRAGSTNGFYHLRYIPR
jgi:hypothetical protein